MSTSADFRATYNRLGGAYKIDPRMVEAVVRQESAGKPHAFRYEPGIRQASYGLMQVLGSTARNLGLESSMSESCLCEPDIGILYGVKVLAENLNKYSAATQLDRQNGAFAHMTTPPFPFLACLARYNGGWKGNPGDDGKTLRNQEYVLGVLSHFAAVCKEVA